MTTFFDPQNSLPVHIELLPSDAYAVSAKLTTYSPRRNLTYDVLDIIAWTNRQSPLTCITGGNNEEWLESNCYDCTWHTEQIELDIGDYDLEVCYDGEMVTPYGDCFASSPCPCYDDGLGAVEWPCAAGLDGPEACEDLDTKLVAKYLTYGIQLDPTDNYYRRNDYCFQQYLVGDEDGDFYATSWERACNTFDHEIQRVCWGEANTPLTIQEMSVSFAAANANEDLLPFDSHNDNAEEIDEELDHYANGTDPLTHRPDAVAVAYAGRPMGLAVVTTLTPVPYVYMSSVGCRKHMNAVYIPVSLYRDVALSDDCVMDVWVSDALPNQHRLAFIQTDSAHRTCTTPNYGLVGQLIPDFDLKPCESTPQSSSDAVELDNSSSPASCDSSNTMTTEQPTSLPTTETNSNSTTVLDRLGQAVARRLL